MKLPLLLPLSVAFFMRPAAAQEVLWASKVLAFSSEVIDREASPKFRARQVLGKPNVFPKGEETPCAWTPNGSKFGEDYITVSFDKPLIVKQILVSENKRPGGISRLIGLDQNGLEVPLFDNDETPPREDGRVFRVFTPDNKKAIQTLTVLLRHDRVPGQKQIDAIAISNSETPIELAINEVKKTTSNELIFESAGPEVNSMYDEVAPVISPDGREMYFTRIGHPENIYTEANKRDAQDIWVATNDGRGNWKEVKNVGPPLNDVEFNAVSCISADGKSLFVLNEYLPNGGHALGLSRSRREGKKWSFPQKISIENFQALSHTEKDRDGREYTRTYTEFSMSPDEKILLMGLKRVQTFGERDLYVSFKQADGNYSKPLNLGPIINTADMEGSPFLAADGRTLYFMSKGHLGYGNGDLFMAKRLDDTWVNWSEPQNLGKPINNEQWNGYISLPASGDLAYVASTTPRNRIDIFRLRLLPEQRPDVVALVSGQVLDTDTKQPLPAKLLLRNLSKATNTQPLDLQYNEQTGEYKTILTGGANYGLSASLKGYFETTELIELEREKHYREIKQNVYLTPIKAGQKIVLNSLFFDQTKAEIKEASYPELERVIGLLQEYAAMQILLEGHTDNSGDWAQNVELSKKRVAEVKNYLTARGISPDRIEVKGWGPTRPVISNASEESRKKNRRVELSIVKM